MRTTLALDDELVAKAQAYTGVLEKTALVREALKALIEREAARRLARLGDPSPICAPPAAATEADVILADTSVWIDHLGAGDRTLADLLLNGEVLTHPFVIGELALGHLRQRDLVLAELDELPRAVVAHDREVLQFIARHALFGTCIGYVDAHLLAAIRLTGGARLWTRDSRLSAAADKLGLAMVL